VVSIRPAVPSDASRLAAIAERTFREAFAADNAGTDIDLYCAQYFRPELQRGEISDPMLITLLAEAAGELIGFAQLRLKHAVSCIHFEQPAELNRLYVASEWHGRGAAHDLMRAVFEEAGRALSDCIWLGVWERNARAIAFYRKFQFRIVGDHSFMLGRDRQRDLILVAEVKGPSFLSDSTSVALEGA
jgi:diamine N-acetyltransferase